MKKKIEPVQEQSEELTIGKFTYHALKMPDYDLVDKEDMNILYDMLSFDKVPLHYKDLIINLIIHKYGTENVKASLISSIYTNMNVDARFEYMENSLWGLTEWKPVEIKRKRKKKKDEEETENNDISTDTSIDYDYPDDMTEE